jgi:hypothetical protein
MSELEEFLLEKVEPAPVEGELGEETGWLPFCTIQLAGNRFAVGEAFIIPDPQFAASIDCPAGQYQVLAKVIDYSGDRWISRLRVIRFDLEEANNTTLASRPFDPVLGSTVTQVSLDSELLAVYDQDVLEPIWESIGEEEGNDLLDQAFADGESLGIVNFGQTAVPFLAVGFGEGDYEIFELLRDGQRLGFEIEFIPSLQPYPAMDFVDSDGAEEDSAGASERDAPPSEPGVMPPFDRPFRIFAKAYQQYLQRRSGDETRDKDLARELAESILTQLDGDDTGSPGSS